MSLCIGITYDLRTEYLALGFSLEDVAEFDSEETISAVDETLRSLGHRTVRVGSARSLCKRLVAGERWDLVFNIAEGVGGRCREAHVPAILEVYDIPYTFSDPLVCAVTLDKAVAKTLVAAVGLNTPGFRLVSSVDDLDGLALAFPVFAKPNAEGTGKGIDAQSRMETLAQVRTTCAELLRRYRGAVIVEEYLPGREFTVAILGTGSRARVLGTMQVEVLAKHANAIYSFETKEQCDTMVRYSRPAKSPLKTAVEDLALRSFLALDCRDVGRVDIRLDSQGRPSFLEVNPLPGIHPSHSDLPMIATQEGMSYRDLIAGIVESASARIRR